MELTSVLSLMSYAWPIMPYLLPLVLGFLIGCWFYRWMLKRNPERLQKLVDLVNSTGDQAKDLVAKVEEKISKD